MNLAKADKVVFESDCLDSIIFINDPTSQAHWSAKVLVEEIRRFLFLWPKWKLKFISRNANFASHNLAFWSVNSKRYGCIHVNSLPSSYFCDGAFPLVDSFQVFN